MSGYTIGEIIGWLLAAAVLGFIIGWLLRSLWRATVSVGAHAEGSAGGALGLKDVPAAAFNQEFGVSGGLDGLKTRLADLSARARGGGGAAVEAPLGDIEGLGAGGVGLDVGAGAYVGAGVDADAAVDAALGDLGAEFGFSGGLPGLRAYLAELSARAGGEPLGAGAPLGVQPLMGTAAPEAAKPSAEEARAQVASIAERTARGESLGDDDLKLIHGVGPQLEQLLKSMGISSFKQVARFAREDIAMVSAALEVFPDRIERDDWMSSARQLHQEHYGEDPLG